MRYQNKVRLCLLTVFAAGIAAAQPKVTSVVNNSSFAPPGSPSYGIAQGSLFAITGTGLGPDQVPSLPDLSQGPLLTSLSGVSVTVGGVRVPLYYVSATQIAGVLPSAIATGSGTLTVSFNNQTSAAVTVPVVASAFGLSAGVLNASKGYGYVTAATAANPGDTIILWGTGLGASAGDETKFPFPQVDLAGKSNAKVYIGGQAAVVAYAGRSQFPAVDQINVVVPAGASGCNVGVTVQTGNFVSNTGTIAVAQSGNVCSDPATTGLTPTEFQDFLNKGTVRAGYITLGKATVQTPAISAGPITVPGSTTTADSAFAGFSQYTASQFNSTGGSSVQTTSLGSCTTYQVQGQSAARAVTLPLILDAGTITMKLPNSNNLTLQKDKAGTYSLSGNDAQGSQSALFIPSTGGLFSFTNTGGADVGQISGAQITMPPSLIWTNMSSITTVTRSQGVTVTWSTANPYNGVVTISGASIAGITSGNAVATGFTCMAPYSAGTFTVPPYILLALVAGEGSIGGISIPTGSLSLGLSSPPVRFNAPSIDYAFLIGFSSTGKSLNYQ